ncbi:hypothetical protein BJY01DRAFT_251073 [Aspergillus pseudoustus]|uniref:Homeodomain-like protein n=1 Tax=Aspergillus pseudoustus TaxID=1810923 RepID=A0ABR4JGR9_9EURO
METCEDCRKRWIKLDSKINKGPWSQEENKRLHEAVAKYSTVWTEVAQIVGTRQPDQCAKRWQHFLDPGLNRSEWTPEEDDILVAEVEKRGRNWKQIVDEVLHRRSANDAKNRFTILQRMRTSTNNSTSASPRRPAMSRRMTATTVESSTSPSPQPDITPGFYGLTPESMGGSTSHRQHQQQQYGEMHITPISNSELGHDPDLSLNHMFFHGGAGKEPSPNTAAATAPSTSPSYLGAASGSTPEILRGEMDTDQGSVSLESWVDYVMGTGLLAGTDCASSTPGLCHEDESGRMDAPARSEEDGGELMHLDAPPPHPPTTTPTRLPTTAVDDLHQQSLEWNWDQIPDIDLRATTTPAAHREAEEAIIRKNRTMILHQMQPEQISRVMDFLLSWNTPIDVKIVNPE